MSPDEEDEHEARRIVQEWATPLRDRQDPDLDGIRIGLGGRPMHWIDDGQGRVTPVSVMVWSEYMESGDRVVQQDLVNRRWFRGHFRVSTVFLGLDHNYMMFGPPILYETMVFRHTPLHALLERLGLDALVDRWQRFRLHVHFTRGITLPSIIDMTCEWQWRYATRAEALEGHLRIREQVGKGVPPSDWGEPD